MPSYPVSPRKQAALLRLMQQLGLREDDLTEKFVRASGPGGQKVNKSSSCVYLRHEPTGIEVKCQSARSQALNRYLARCEMCEKLAELDRAVKTKRRQEIEKIKRQKRKRSKRAKEKILQDKRYLGEKKQLRKKPLSKD
ncbi:MAG: peptide chain release factor-like protein [Bdellovibrionales bacterium]|nr:peptide chain release factor-like protein [Bdellovibrionales bacterium]